MLGLGSGGAMHRRMEQSSKGGWTLPRPALPWQQRLAGCPALPDGRTAVFAAGISLRHHTSTVRILYSTSIGSHNSHRAVRTGTVLVRFYRFAHRPPRVYCTRTRTGTALYCTVVYPYSYQEESTSTVPNPPDPADRTARTSTRTSTFLRVLYGT